MWNRIALLAVLSFVLAVPVACGGDDDEAATTVATTDEGETEVETEDAETGEADTGETETELETNGEDPVTETDDDDGAGEDDRAYQLARDLCADIPREALALAVGDPTARDARDIARAFAERTEPDLRDAAEEGCLAGLESQ